MPTGVAPQRAEQRFDELAKRLCLSARDRAALVSGNYDADRPLDFTSRQVRMRQFIDLAQSVSILTGDWQLASAWLTRSHPALQRVPLTVISNDAEALATMRAILVREAYAVSAIRSFF